MTSDSMSLRKPRQVTYNEEEMDYVILAEWLADDENENGNKQPENITEGDVDEEKKINKWNAILRNQPVVKLKKLQKSEIKKWAGSESSDRRRDTGSLSNSQDANEINGSSSSQTVSKKYKGFNSGRGIRLKKEKAMDQEKVDPVKDLKARGGVKEIINDPSSERIRIESSSVLVESLLPSGPAGKRASHVDANVSPKSTTKAKMEPEKLRECLTKMKEAMCRLTHRKKMLDKKRQDASVSPENNQTGAGERTSGIGTNTIDQPQACLNDSRKAQTAPDGEFRSSPKMADSKMTESDVDNEHRLHKGGDKIQSSTKSLVSDGQDCMNGDVLEISNAQIEGGDNVVAVQIDVETFDSEREQDPSDVPEPMCTVEYGGDGVTSGEGQLVSENGTRNGHNEIKGSTVEVDGITDVVSDNEGDVIMENVDNVVDVIEEDLYGHKQCAHEEHLLYSHIENQNALQDLHQEHFPVDKTNEESAHKEIENENKQCENSSLNVEAQDTLECETIIMDNNSELILDGDNIIICKKDMGPKEDSELCKETVRKETGLIPYNSKSYKDGPMDLSLKAFTNSELSVNNISEDIEMSKQDHTEHKNENNLREKDTILNLDLMSSLNEECVAQIQDIDHDHQPSIKLDQECEKQDRNTGVILQEEEPEVPKYQIPDTQDQEDSEHYSDNKEADTDTEMQSSNVDLPVIKPYIVKVPSYPMPHQSVGDVIGSGSCPMEKLAESNYKESVQNNAVPEENLTERSSAEEANIPVEECEGDLSSLNGTSDIPDLIEPITDAEQNQPKNPQTEVDWTSGSGNGFGTVQAESEELTAQDADKETEAKCIIDKETAELSSAEKELEHVLSETVAIITSNANSNNALGTLCVEDAVISKGENIIDHKEDPLSIDTDTDLSSSKENITEVLSKSHLNQTLSNESKDKPNASMPVVNTHFTDAKYIIDKADENKIANNPQSDQEMPQLVRDEENKDLSLADKDQSLSDKDQNLSDKNQCLSDKDHSLPDKDQILSDKDVEVIEISATVNMEDKESLVIHNKSQEGQTEDVDMEILDKSTEETEEVTKSAADTKCFVNNDKLSPGALSKLQTHPNNMDDNSAADKTDVQESLITSPSKPAASVRDVNQVDKAEATIRKTNKARDRVKSQLEMDLDLSSDSEGESNEVFQETVNFLHLLDHKDKVVENNAKPCRSEQDTLDETISFLKELNYQDKKASVTSREDQTDPLYFVKDKVFSPESSEEDEDEMVDVTTGHEGEFDNFKHKKFGRSWAESKNVKEKNEEKDIDTTDNTLGESSANESRIDLSPSHIFGSPSGSQPVLANITGGVNPVLNPSGQIRPKRKRKRRDWVSEIVGEKMRTRNKKLMWRFCRCCLEIIENPHMRTYKTHRKEHKNVHDSKERKKPKPTPPKINLHKLSVRSPIHCPSPLHRQSYFLPKTKRVYPFSNFKTKPKLKPKVVKQKPRLTDCYVKLNRINIQENNELRLKPAQVKKNETFTSIKSQKKLVQNSSKNIETFPSKSEIYQSDQTKKSSVIKCSGISREKGLHEKDSSDISSKEEIKSEKKNGNCKKVLNIENETSLAKEDVKISSIPLQKEKPQDLQSASEVVTGLMLECETVSSNFESPPEHCDMSSSKSHQKESVRVSSSKDTGKLKKEKKIDFNMKIDKISNEKGNEESEKCVGRLPVVPNANVDCHKVAGRDLDKGHMPAKSRHRDNIKHKNRHDKVDCGKKVVMEASNAKCFVQLCKLNLNGKVGFNVKNANLNGCVCNIRQHSKGNVKKRKYRKKHLSPARERSQRHPKNVMSRTLSWKYPAGEYIIDMPHSETKSKQKIVSEEENINSQNTIKSILKTKESRYGKHYRSVVSTTTYEGSPYDFSDTPLKVPSPMAKRFQQHAVSRLQRAGMAAHHRKRPSGAAHFKAHVIVPPEHQRQSVDTHASAKLKHSAPGFNRPRLMSGQQYKLHKQRMADKMNAKQQALQAQPPSHVQIVELTVGQSEKSHSSVGQSEKSHSSVGQSEKSHSSTVHTINDTSQDEGLSHTSSTTTDQTFELFDDIAMGPTRKARTPKFQSQVIKPPVIRPAQLVKIPELDLREYNAFEDSQLDMHERKIKFFDESEGVLFIKEGSPIKPNLSQFKNPEKEHSFGKSSFDMSSLRQSLEGAGRKKIISPKSPVMSTSPIPKNIFNKPGNLKSFADLKDYISNQPEIKLFHDLDENCDNETSSKRGRYFSAEKRVPRKNLRVSKNDRTQIGEYDRCSQVKETKGQEQSVPNAQESSATLTISPLPHSVKDSASSNKVITPLIHGKRKRTAPASSQEENNYPLLKVAPKNHVDINKDSSRNVDKNGGHRHHSMPVKNRTISKSGDINKNDASCKTVISGSIKKRGCKRHLPNNKAVENIQEGYGVDEEYDKNSPPPKRKQEEQETNNVESLQSISDKEHRMWNRVSILGERFRYMKEMILQKEQEIAKWKSQRSDSSPPEGDLEEEAAEGTGK